MPILAGQIVTAADLNHLKPATYSATADANLVGVVTDTDISGATITFSTETDNAVYVAIGFFDMDWTGTAGTGAVIIGKLAVDGVVQTPEAHAEQAAGVNGDRISTSEGWRGTLATAGSHTIKLVGTVPDVDQKINAIHSTLLLEIHEVV